VSHILIFKSSLIREPKVLLANSRMAALITTRTRTRATVIHGKNRVEEKNPHAERSVDRRDPGIPAARESLEKSLKRRRRRCGERGSGVEEDAKRYLHPGPLLYIG
jgi:hypothetical protein